jgi:hypothetical protein
MTENVLGTYLRLFLRGGYVDVLAEEEGGVDAAVSMLVDYGPTRDSLLHLTRTDGDRHVLRASLIEGWLLSTPMGRAAFVQEQVLGEQEDEENKKGVGGWYD